MGRIAKKIKDKNIRKFFSSDSYDRNLELMKLLVSDERFQKVVSSARKRLNIPTEGIGSSDKSMEQWYDWLVSETDQVLESKEFREQGDQIRQMLKSKTIGYMEAKEMGEKLDDTTPLNYYGKEPVKIAKRFNIPIHFKEAIQKYILTGIIDAPQHNYSGADWQPGERPWYAGYIPLRVYTQLTDDEWKEFRAYVDNLAKNWLPKHTRIPKIDEYVKVEEIYKRGAQIDNISGKSYKISTAEVAEEFYGTPKKDTKVRDILRKIENLRKSRLTLPDRGPKRGKK